MKERLKKLDKPLLITILVLIVFGLIMVFSASSIAAKLSYEQTEYYFFQKQLIIVGVSLLICLIVVDMPTTVYGFLSRVGMIGIIAALIALRFYGTEINGAKSWFVVGTFSIQPSEFAKTVVILYLACVYGNKKRFKSVYDLFLPILPVLIIFGLVYMEPDLGVALIIAMISMFIFFTLPLGKSALFKILRAAVILIIGAGIIFINNNQDFLTTIQASRLNFKNPCSRYLDHDGYQVCNGYIAINNGGLFGSGLGNSKQKYLYLPEAHTDFIFPIIVEELGVIGAAFLLFLYIILLYRVLYIARNASNLRGSIIAFGTFSYILIHIAVNLGGVLAFIPMTGVPLPFMSYGGSFYINLLVLLAITLRVGIESKATKYDKKFRKALGG